MKNINICIASDNGYAEHMHVVIYSLLYNLKKGIRANFHILDGGISEENKEQMKKSIHKLGNGKIDFLYVDPKKYAGLNTLHLTKEAYYRIEIPELFKDIDRMLYLDCDIVIDQNISDIFNYNIDDYAIGAPLDIGMNNYYNNILKIPYTHGYLNSGVLLMNLDYMRKMNISQKVFEYVKKNANKLIACDQDALNAILYNKRLRIPLKYNALDWVFIAKELEGFSKEELHETQKKPVCIHYAGEKPWGKYCSHPLKDKYHEYRRLAGLEPVKTNRTFVLKDRLKHIKWNLGLFLLTHMNDRQYRIFIRRPMIFLSNLFKK